MRPNAKRDIVIASALYPQARPFLNDFFASIERAVSDYNVRVFLTCEDVDDWADYLPPRPLNIHTERLKSGLSMGQAREELFQLAKKHVTDLCIFVDADDMLTPDAITHYLSALESADFACGNLALTDVKGHKLPYQPLYEEWGVSGSMCDAAPLLNGNILGLGAVAVNKICLDHVPDAIPSALVGVDWWIFHHLLEQGFKAQLIQDTTILYRQHGNNVSGIFPTDNVEILQKRVQIALTHFAHLEPNSDILKRIQGLKRLMAALDDKAEFDMVISHNHKPIPWYSDVIEMALKLAD